MKLAAFEFVLPFYLFRYGRVGAMCVGKLALNLFKFPNSGFCQRLYQFIEKIVPKVSVV